MLSRKRREKKKKEKKKGAIHISWRSRIKSDDAPSLTCDARPRGKLEWTFRASERASEKERASERDGGKERGETRHLRAYLSSSLYFLIFSKVENIRFHRTHTNTTTLSSDLRSRASIFRSRPILLSLSFNRRSSRICNCVCKGYIFARERKGCRRWVFF